MVMNWLPEKVRYEIQTYESSKRATDLMRTHVFFCGSPLRHPHDPEKIVLIVNPLGTNTFCYGFRSEDISYMEKLPSLVSLEGEAITMARIWVKKKSVGICYGPFLVENECQSFFQAIEEE